MKQDEVPEMLRGRGWTNSGSFSGFPAKTNHSLTAGPCVPVSENTRKEL
jgi:hypothetical protein